MNLEHLALLPPFALTPCAAALSTLANLTPNPSSLASNHRNPWS